MRSDRFAPFRQKIVDAVLGGAGEADGATRRAAFAGEGVPAPLAAYVDQVHRHAYRITDEDVAALRGAGQGEDTIFEVTAAAAVGAALERLEAGLRALDEAEVAEIKEVRDAPEEG